MCFALNIAKEYRYDAVMEIDVDILLEAIRPSNLVVLFLAAVLEYKIIFLSAISSSSLLVVAEWLKLMMQPLEWCHIYAPTAPESITIPLMHCPTPYVIGLNTKSFDNYAYSYYLKNDEELLDSIGDVVVLDIDADIISLSDSLAEIEPIGHLLVDRVAAIAKPSLLYADSLQSALHMAASLPRNKTASMVSSADSNVPASNRDDKAIDNVSRDQTNKPRKYRSTKTKNYRLSKVFHNFVKDLLLPIDNACVTFGDEQETVVVMDEANLHNGNATVNNRSNTKKTNKGKNSFVATEFYNSKFYPIFMERFLRTQTLSNYITTKFE